MTQPEVWNSIKARLEKFGESSGLFSKVTIERSGKSGSHPFQLKMKIRGPQVNLRDVGYGVSQILPILVRMFRKENTYFLIQQPELHLHPKGQAALASLMIENHKQQGNIFIVETHSDYMVNRARIAIMKGNIAAEDVSLIYLAPKKNIVEVHNITFDKNGNLKGEPAGYREFFLNEVNDLMGL